MYTVDLQGTNLYESQPSMLPRQPSFSANLAREPRWRAPLPRRSGLDFLRLFPSGSIRRIQFHLLAEFRQGSRQVAL